jgi:lipopolysaccharide transport system permease protein
VTNSKSYLTAYVQISELLGASLKVRYRKTWVGFFWVLLNPVIVLSVQGFVFSHLLNLPVETYAIYLISGFLPWIFLSQTLEMGTSQLKSQATVIKALSVKPFFITLSQALENLINFFASALFIVIPLLVITGKPVWLALYWIPSAVPLFIVGLSLTFFAATSNILLRDLRYIISFGLTLLYFLTPIFYPRDFVPEQYRWFLDVNPMTALISPFQVLSQEAGFAGWFLKMLAAMGVAAASGLITYCHWKKIRTKFFLNI